MAGSRKKAPPASPAPPAEVADDEEDEDEEKDGAPPEEDAKAPAAPAQEAPQIVPQPTIRERPRGPLDEPLGRPGVAPGAVRFTPTFPTAMLGGNRLEPLRPIINLGQPGQSQQEPQYPDQPRRDGSPAEEAASATAGRETDILVNAFVDYEDIEHGGQMVACGSLQRVTMSRATQPETYIPSWVGGDTFWIRMYHATAIAGQIGRQVSQPFAYRTGSPKPFVRGWRVDMDIEQMIDQRLTEAGIPVRARASPYPAPQGIPRTLYDSETAYQRERADRLEQRLNDVEKRAWEERLAAQQREFDARLRQVESGGGGQNQVIQTIGALAPFIQNKDDGSKWMEYALRMNGPDMMIAQAKMYEGVMDAVIKANKSGTGAAEGIMGVVGPLVKGAAEKYIDGMNERQKARDVFVMKMKEKEAERVATPAAPSPQPTQGRAPAPTNGGSIDQAVFGRLFGDVKDALRTVTDPSVPEPEKATAGDVGRKLALCMQTAIESKLWADPIVLSMVRECLADPVTKALNGDPELFISKLAVAFNLPMQFAADASVAFRGYVGLPPLRAKPTAKPAEAEVEAVVAEAPARAASAIFGLADIAPSPTAGKPQRGTVRLPLVSPPTGQPTSAAPGAASGAARAVAPPTAPVPPVAPEPPSPEVEGQNAVGGEVGDPQGAVHVVAGDEQTAPAESPQEGDPQGEVGKPPEEDAVGLVEPAVPPVTVQEPPVP